MLEMTGKQRSMRNYGMTFYQALIAPLGLVSINTTDGN
jgi:hypothetical protein